MHGEKLYIENIGEHFKNMFVNRLAGQPFPKVTFSIKILGFRQTTTQLSPKKLLFSCVCNLNI